MEVINYDTEGYFKSVSEDLVASDFARSKKQLESQGYEYENFLRGVAMSDEDFRMQLRKGLIIKKRFPEFYAPSTNWSTVKKYYQTHINEYTIGSGDSAKTIPYEEVKDQISDKLQLAEMDEANRRYLESRMRNIPVKVFEENVIYNPDF